MHQHFLACGKDDYAIGIAQSYMTDEQRKEVDKVLDSLEIDCDSSG